MWTAEGGKSLDRREQRAGRKAQETLEFEQWCRACGRPDPITPRSLGPGGLALCLESPPRTLEGVAAMGVGQEVARASAVQTKGSCPSVQMGIDSLCFLSSICVVCFPLTVSDD